MLYLLATILLVFANGFFVAAEFALVKVRGTQLEVLEEDGNRLAGLAHSLVKHLDGYLSATQLGITLTSLGLGWIGEPAMARILEPVFHWAGLPEDMLHRTSVIVGFAVISFAHIVVGEVAPKSLAIAKPVGVSMAVSAPMRVFYVLFYPFLIVLNASSNLLLRMVGVEPAGTHSIAIAADELVRIAEQSAAGGQISAEQGAMVSNLFAFSERVAREIMVPRPRVHGIDLQADVRQELLTALEHGHSRYPVYEGDMDELVGVLHLKDLVQVEFSAVTADTLRGLARPPVLVPEQVRAEAVMRLMQSGRSHLAIVVDEHGAVSGVVSLEDALEELVGDIQDEYDHEDERVHATPDGFELSGSLPLDELEEALEIDVSSEYSDTVQGLLMERLERLPRVGDSIAVEPWILHVRAVEGRAVTRVAAIRNDAPAEA